MQHLSGFFDDEAQRSLLSEIERVLNQAPLFTPRMPRTGKPFSVRMSNCGTLGWVSDKEKGYRYEASHPETGEPWPPIPQMLLDLWAEHADYPELPEACLINIYGTNAKMGLHRDEDEEDFSAPVISVSLGCTGLFRLGGQARRDATRSFDLKSGDVLILDGDDRLAFHGIDRIKPDTGQLDLSAIPDCARINLTLRRVTKG